LTGNTEGNRAWRAAGWLSYIGEGTLNEGRGVKFRGEKGRRSDITRGEAGEYVKILSGGAVCEASIQDREKRKWGSGESGELRGKAEGKTVFGEIRAGKGPFGKSRRARLALLETGAGGEDGVVTLKP